MNAFDLNGKRVIIAKTGHLGDVIISLPMATVLKRYFPQCQVIFLATGAACKIAEMSPHVDEVYAWENIHQQNKAQAVAALKALQADIFLHVNPDPYLAMVAKKAKIPVRVGSVFRWYNWFTCNRFALISRNSGKYNKRQLDLQYLQPLGIKSSFSYAELCDLYQFKKRELPVAILELLNPQKFKLIIHPTLITSLYKWPIEHYSTLIEQLPAEHYQIFISGTPNEHDLIKPLLDRYPHVIDLAGKMSLDDYIIFLQHCDGLIAGSTGPLHMAAAVGIHSLGIYWANERYIKRWEPVGLKAEIITSDTPTHSCPNGDPCHCMWSIPPEKVKQRVEAWRAMAKSTNLMGKQTEVVKLL